MPSIFGRCDLKNRTSRPFEDVGSPYNFPSLCIVQRMDMARAILQERLLPVLGKFVILARNPAHIMANTEATPQHKPKKCIIDNWSLEHAAVLLESSNDLGQKSNKSIINNLGGLSNFINSILLYENSFFIMNGFEQDWKRFNWFERNTRAFLKGAELDELVINWTSASSYRDKGIRNYLLTSTYFESDLLVCPERSGITRINSKQLDSTFFEVLREIDKKILHEKDNSAFSKIKIGIDANFRVPSMTQYVLSEASTRDDLLPVIMQLKSDGKIRRTIDEIEEITSTARGAGKFEKDIQELVRKAFGRKPDVDNSFQ
jgi:hypothetical protein